MKRELFNLTNPQRSILLTEEFYKGTNINNICGTAIISDTINFNVLKRAMNIFVKNHDSFSIKLTVDNSEIKQYLGEIEDIDVEIVDINTKDEISNIENEMLSHVFDIYSDKLFCMKIFRLPDNTGGFIVNVHHLIGDSWTLGIVANDIVRIYSCLLRGEEVIKNDDFSYIDYIYSEKDYLSSDKYIKDKEYWNNIFETIPEQATIPSSISDNNNFSCKANRCMFNIDNDLMDKINNYCKLNHVSVFNFFMAIYSIYIGRVSNLDDFVIGTPILNRTNFKEKNTTGMFINTAPLRINMDNVLDFKSFVSNIAKDSLGMLRHQKYYYQNILEDLRQKDSNLPNLYNVLISYQVTKASTEKDVNYNTRWSFNGNTADDIDIHLFDLNDSGSIDIAYDYKIEKYTDSDITDMHNRILHIIWQILEKNDICLSDIEIVTSKEKYDILYKFNNTDLEYDENIPFINYFEEQVKKHPNEVAITFHNKNIDYKTLNEKANSLANLLRENSITNNSIVGIMVDRSFEMIISILAVLKSGGGYIPIDPDYPDDRINYMVEDSKMQIILTNKNINKNIKCSKTIYVDLTESFYNINIDNLKSISKPDDLSYLIYTSGSTGVPKGVMLTQKSLANFYHAMKQKIEYLSCEKQYRVVSITTVSFDIFAFETLISLACGLHLFISDNFEQKSTIQLEKLISENKIEIIQSTPSVMRYHLDNLQDKNNFSSLKYVILAGEQLPLDLVKLIKSISPDCTVYNGYGPSETTIFSSVQNVTNLEKINIGKPIANTQFYILDNNMNLLPKGHIGEIYISGDGLGKGYLFKPDLTQKNFLMNPFGNGLLYKTGDLGLWLNDGTIECKGRIDHQVKLRGLRIELEEIENKINSYKQNMKSAVVVRNNNGIDSLYAFIENNEKTNHTDLRNFLKLYLPSYMIPNYFITLDELPKTPNGKTDRKYLKTFPISINVEQKETILPKNQLEESVFNILSDITNKKDFSMDDDFLSIGMDSLSLINFTTKLQTNFKVQISIKELYNFSSIIDCVKFIENANQSTNIKITKTILKNNYPLSSAQKRIYYATKMADENSLVYNIPGSLLIDAVLDKEKIVSAFKEIVKLNSSFRTCFKLVNDEPYQFILDEVKLDIQFFNDTESNIQNITDNFVKPFDLEKAPLLNIAVYYLDNKKTLVLLNSHHIIVDGTSLNTIIKDFCELYNGNEINCPDLDYTDFAVWENNFINSEHIKPLEEFWLNKFKDIEIPNINLPYDFSMPVKQSFVGNKISGYIPDELFLKLENTAKEIGVSSYMLFLSAFYILLYKYTSQEDIIIGSPVTGRTSADLNDIIGMFVNNLSLYAHIDASNTFSDFLQNIKGLVVDAIDNQAYPYDLLVKKLNLKGSNLFDVMFIYQNTEKPNVLIDGKPFTIIEANSNIAKFNLSLEIIPDLHKINLEYCTDLFKEDTISRMLNHYINLLNVIATNANSKIADLSILSNEERKQILYDFNNTKTDYPSDKTIAELFEEQVEKTPDNIAVVFENSSLTYKELNEKANQLAWYLRNNGISRNDVVSIMVNRSLELIIAIIGVLKSGACYIPIDPNYPIDRTEYMLNNSNSKLLLTDSNLSKKISFSNKVSINLCNTSIYSNNEISNPNCINKSDDTSYIIYTSGSTGIPKGVMLKHKALTNLAFYLNNYIPFLNANNNISIASVTTASFDIFIFETLICLQKGLKVVLANEEEQRIPVYLDKLIKDNNVKAIQMTPSRMRLFIDNIDSIPNLNNLDYVVLAGEPLPDKLLNDLITLGIKKVYNGYGPSETTVFSTFTDVTNYPKVNIGKPLNNTQMYLLDKDLNPVPIGVVGELYISGDGVGKGYLNNPTITNKSFINNPFIHNSTMYKTGDLCKYLANGELCYYGRVDNQVKIRGLRIELEEIENKLLEIPLIKKVKVVKQTVNNRDFISAYYVAQNEITINELRKHLYTSLPSYMIPSYFTMLEDFPYTPNGKIDKNDLPMPNINLDNAVAYVAPKNDFEKLLIKILEEILNTNNIGMQDNFFELGGDSLSAILLCTNVLKEFKVKLSFGDILQSPIIGDIANIINNKLTVIDNDSIMPAEIKAYYPVSFAQKRIYLASSMDTTNNTLYNITGGILFDTLPDINKLQKCMDILVKRHESLRTYFEIIDGNVVQKIVNITRVKIEIEDSNTNDINYLLDNYKPVFNLEVAPLLNVKLIKLSNKKYLLMLCIHHIIFDGASLNIFIKELCDLYNSCTLPELYLSYKDFAVWENEQYSKNNFNVHENYWLDKFKEDLPVLNLPTTYQRPANKSYEGNVIVKYINTNLVDKINTICKNHEVTPYMFLLSAYYILLYKYTSQEDIIVGSPISGRIRPELNDLLGMFVNTLAIRSNINPNMSILEFINDIKTNCLKAFEHQSYPFDMLVTKLNLNRDSSRSPLFDTMFTYQNSGYTNLNFKNIESEYIVPLNKTSKFDISLEVLPIDGNLKLSFEYCTKLFDTDFIDSFSNHYINIINTIVENMEEKILTIDILSNEERKQILYDFNNTKMDYPSDKSIAELFEEQVEKTPDNIAVVFENSSLTYKELNEKANQLARFLIANNVESNDIVCLLLNKSLESIIAIMAILKIGAIYLPIDVDYPDDRIDYIIRDSKSKVLLTTKNYIHKSNSTIKALCIDLESTIYTQNNIDNINCTDIYPDSLAYIMYTSGSTGNPKGVMVKHKNIIRLIKNTKFITFGDKERILQTGSIVFDACTFEIFGALLNGFELYIIKKEELLDSKLLAHYLTQNKISILWLTAPLFNQLCEENANMFKDVKILLTGGDVLSPKHINMARTANPNLTIINGYGPTENTTFSCCFTIDKEYNNSIPIGKPISNSTAYVVSPSGNLNPIGVPGELWVGGDGVAKGYLNNDKLTNEKFTNNPFGEGLVYKTGDLVKWLPDGTIDFIGRIDNQVKIRGFRVELGEINSKLSTFPSMKECVTVVNEIKGEKTICAYIVADKQIDIQDLKQFLKKNLPTYMIPTYFMQLDKLPINTNGKIDRKLLPTNFKLNNNKDKIKLPTNNNEKILLDIFKKLLSFEDIGIDDDFFELGGNSLLAIKLQVEAISNDLQIKYSDIFEHHTVEELAKCIDKKDDIYIKNDTDYSKYDPILEKNKITSNIKISSSPIGNVLLTGFTGFLGAHVLDSFIKKEQGNIYCLIRGKNNMSPQERLENVLHFYFDTRYDKYIGNRIKVVDGDITLQDFGLNTIDYNILGTNVNTVIHCAALVKHYGSYKDFESINILGTKRVIDFAKLYNLKLLHVSTISVSGNNLAEGANIENNFEKEMIFNETNFYIGQNLKNFYVRSKFEAEKLVFDAILDGLQACILRMGNLTSRYSEGKFQQNHFENAFVNKIKSFIQIGCIPDYLLQSYCEFTPIDFCGDAIINIANHMNNYTVFHLLNEKHVYLDRLFKMLTEIGINVNLVSEEKFKNILLSILKDDNRRNDLDGIINNLDDDKKFIYKSDVMIESHFTKQFLQHIGFEWPYIDTNYIRNYFKYLTNIGYFNLNIN